MFHMNFMREVGRTYNRLILNNFSNVRGLHFLSRTLERFVDFKKIEFFEVEEVEMLGYGNSRQVKDLVLNRDIEEIEVLKFLEDKLSSEDVFVDVGSNFGLFANYVHDSVGSEICCFEPRPSNVNMLRLNRYIYNRNYEIVNKAASDKLGESELYLSRSNEGQGGLEKKDKKNYVNSVEVKTTRLDKALENPDIIKIDVEGAELEVLKGAEGILDAVEFLVIELHSNDILRKFKTSRSEILNFLNERGFVITNYNSSRLKKCSEERANIICESK